MVATTVQPGTKKDGRTTSRAVSEEMHLTALARLHEGGSSAEGMSSFVLHRGGKRKVRAQVHGRLALLSHTPSGGKLVDHPWQLPDITARLAFALECECRPCFRALRGD